MVSANPGRMDCDDMRHQSATRAGDVRLTPRRPPLASSKELGTLETYLRDVKRDEEGAEEKPRRGSCGWIAVARGGLKSRPGFHARRINGWVGEKRNDPEFAQPPASRPHFRRLATNPRVIARAGSRLLVGARPGTALGSRAPSPLKLRRSGRGI